MRRQQAPSAAAPQQPSISSASYGYAQADPEPENDGIFTKENIERLSVFANHWAVILHFEKEEVAPNMHIFPNDALVSLFEQNRLCKVTLMAGFKTSHRPKIPVSPVFFRTLEFLLQFVVAGSSYRALTEKELAKGGPPAGWCRVPVIASGEDNANTAQSPLPVSGPGSLMASVAPNDPVRLFLQSGSWCFVYAYHCSEESIRCAMGIPPEQVLKQYKAQDISEYTLMVGLYEQKPKNVWVPPCVMLPLGALLYLQRSGRAYLPLTVAELRDARKGGVHTLFNRVAKPLPLTMQVEIPGYTAEIPGAPSSSTAAAGGEAGRGRSRPQQLSSSGANGSGSSSVLDGRRPTSSGASSPTRGPSSVSPNGPTSTNSAAQTMPRTSSNSGFVMPQPFPDAQQPATSQIPAESALQPSPFLGNFKFGCRPTFETSPFKLFQGSRAQLAFNSNWWFVDAASCIQGPYSCEQMILSYVTVCQEIHDDVLVCGTEGDVRPPMAPTAMCFEKLGDLLRAMDAGGRYVLVTKHDIYSPIAMVASSRVRYGPEPQMAVQAPYMPQTYRPLAP